MLRTTVCAVLGIEVPVVQAPLGGPWRQSMELAAVVSDAGALGSVPTTLRTPAQVRDDVARLRDLTDRPFAVNMNRRPFDTETFDAVMDLSPPVFSFALGDPGTWWPASTTPERCSCSRSPPSSRRCARRRRCAPR
ncbi:nitronate monooxygenase [Streptomyces olindensis]|uniref:nitronate monooxygenase n=1 Tax=Streptomyces olindensis TaxID=358823 RepID=UPI00368C46D9